MNDHDQSNTEKAQIPNNAGNKLAGSDVKTVPVHSAPPVIEPDGTEDPGSNAEDLGPAAHRS